MPAYIFLRFHNLFLRELIVYVQEQVCRVVHVRLNAFVRECHGRICFIGPARNFLKSFKYSFGLFKSGRLQDETSGYLSVSWFPLKYAFI